MILLAMLESILKAVLRELYGMIKCKLLYCKLAKFLGYLQLQIGHLICHAQ